MKQKVSNWKAVIGIATTYVLICIIAITAVFSSKLFTNRAQNVDNSTEVQELNTPEELRAMTYGELKEEDEQTQSENVRFSAFFTRDLNKDGYAERLKGTCKELKESDILYVELDVLTQGYLEGGTIYLNGDKNYIWNTAIIKDEVVPNDYLGSTSSITLSNRVQNGTEKLFQGTVTPNIDDNFNNYSKVNSVTLTGTYVDEQGNRTPINITRNVTVDWYGITETKINDLSGYKVQTYDLESAIKEKTFEVDFQVRVNELIKELLLQKQEVQIEIPRLNGYMPMEVKCTDSKVEYSYDYTTGIITIFRSPVVSYNGKLTKLVDYKNIYNIKIVYPLVAYESMVESQGEVNEISFDINVKGYNYGYNNSNEEFLNPYVSEDEESMSVIYARTIGDIWDIDVTVGDYYSTKYVVSKQLANMLYNGEKYSGKDTQYNVRWRVSIGDYAAIDKITLEEQKKENVIKSDEFSGSGIVKSMYDYLKTVQISFSGASAVLGDEGWIEVYDAETNEIIAHFTSATWNESQEVNVKSIRVITSKPISNASLYVYQKKEINDRLIYQNISEEDFRKLSVIYSYLLGAIDAPEGIEYDNGTSHTELKAWNNAAYMLPESEAEISVAPDKISNQETKNVNIKIATKKESAYQAYWMNGIYLVKMPESLIDFNVKSVTSSDNRVKVTGYETYQENGNYFLKIYTENNAELTYNLIINADVTDNPLLGSHTENVELFAYNDNSSRYYRYSQDTYDINSNGSTEDRIGNAETEISLIAPSSLLTTEYITNYDDEGNTTIAPNIADIEKSDESRTATINVRVLNNYSGTISNTLILGKIPFEGNSYVINGGDLNSKFTTTMKSQINVPNALEGKVKVYYSVNENPTKNLAEASNGWRLAENVTDWSKVKTYLIDFGTYKLGSKEEEIFTYDVEVPAGVGYNKEAFSDHAIFYYLDTAGGKLPIETEPNKVGIRIATKYKLQLTKNKTGQNNTFVKGATYRAVTKNQDGEDIVKTATTDENGNLVLSGLYVGKEYTLTEIISPADFVLDENEIKFVANIENVNNQDKLVFNVTSGSFKHVSTPTLDESGAFVVDAKVEDEPKYTLKINKKGENETGIENVRFSLDGKGQDDVPYRTNENGILEISGLYPNERYTLTELSAEGYYVFSEPKVFSLNRKADGTYEFVGADSDLTLKEINEAESAAQTMVEVNLKNEKIPTFDLEVVKVKENAKEETIAEMKKLGGAKFTLLSEDDTTLKEYTTTEDEVLQIPNLYQFIDGKYITGYYVLQETKAPQGYSNNAEQIRFRAKLDAATNEVSIEIDNKDNLKTLKEVVKEGNTFKFIIEDKPLFKLTKVDSQSGALLANAKFVIYELDADGKVVDFAKDINDDYVGVKNENDEYIVTTDENGEITLPLRGGTYQIREVGFPEGYQESDEGEIFKVEDTGSSEDEEEEESYFDESAIERVIEIEYIEDLIALDSENFGGKFEENGYPSCYLNGTSKIVFKNSLDFNDKNSYRNWQDTSYDYDEDNIEEPLMEELTDPEGPGFNPIIDWVALIDGQGNSVDNIYINRSASGIGLFGEVENSVIMNLNVSGKMKSSTYMGAGGIAFEAKAVINCTANVDFNIESSGGLYFGGVVGLANIVKDCTNKANLKPECSSFGGIVGALVGDSPKIINCVNEGNITGKKSGYYGMNNAYYFGGIVGNTDQSNASIAIIRNCYNIGNIDVEGGFPCVGGIVATGGKAKIENCYNKGTIKVATVVSGQSGAETAGGIICSASNVTVDNCYNEGDITVIKNNYYGNICMGGIVSGCYDDKPQAVKINNSYNKGNLLAQLNYDINLNGFFKIYIGGISAGCEEAKNCYNEGKVDVKYNVNNNIYDTFLLYEGGITAIGKVTSCYNIGNISCIGDYKNYVTSGQKVEQYIGGISGSGQVTNCYNNGNIKQNSSLTVGPSATYCYDYVGGITGSGSTTNVYNTGNIITKYNVKSNTGANFSNYTKLEYKTGGIIGNNNTGNSANTATRSFYLDTITISGGEINNLGVAKTDEQLKSKELYNLLNKDNVWISISNKYPKLLEGIPADISSSTEIEVKNTAKRFNVTTEVASVSGIKGGTITGEGEEPYEAIVYGNNNTKTITMTPKENYSIYNITVNGENIPYTVNPDGTYTIPANYFTDVKEDKHIVVLYETRMKNTVITKIDSISNEPIPNTKFVIYEIDSEKNEVDYARDRSGGYVGIKDSEGRYVLTTDENGKIEASLRGGDYKAVEIEAAPEYYLPEKYEDRIRYFKIGDISINYIEDLVDLSLECSNGEKFEGRTITLSRDLDFNDDNSYRDPTSTEYGNLCGVGENVGIKEQLTSTSGTGFKPFAEFAGTFNGNGNTIRNIYENVPGPSWGGLFDVVTGKVCNLGIVGGTINSVRPAGGITSQLNGGEISNCYNTVTINAPIAGGIVGLTAQNGTVVNCYNTGVLTGTSGAGGIIGNTLTNSKVINCYNKGTISTNINVGGIIGVTAINSTIANCYNTGDITSTGNSAVVVGIVVSADANSKVLNCYNTGNLTGNGVYGIAAQISGEYKNCYYLNDNIEFGIPGVTDSEGILVGMTEEEMKTQDFANLLNANKPTVDAITMADWSFAQNTYPYLNMVTEMENRESSTKIVFENTKASAVLVHHYLKESDGTYTDNKVAEDELYKNKIGKKYTTAPRINLTSLSLEKDASEDYVIPANATGTYEEEPIEVNYYYETEPINLTIHHYLDGTQERLVEDKQDAPVESQVTFEDDGSYVVSANGTYEIKENEDYQNLLQNYNFVRVRSSVSETNTINDTLNYTKDSEVSYYYRLKQYNIDAEVKTHTENRFDSNTNTKIPVEVAGGKIEESTDTTYTTETVEQGENSTKDIIITPDENYTIKSITLVSSNDAGEASEPIIIYGENAVQDAEITYTQNGNGVILTKFNNVNEDKRIIVEFEPVLGTVVVHHYLVGTGEEYGTPAVKVPAQNGGVVENETKHDYIGEVFGSDASSDAASIYEVVGTSEKTSGVYTNNTQNVYYYYDYKNYEYSIEYYYEVKGEEEQYQKDDDATETATAKYHSVIDNYEDKVKTGYKFEKTENKPLTVTENSEANVMKIYYVLDDYSYSVEYYYDNVKDDTKTDSFTAEYQDKIINYTDKVITGYRLDKVEPVNEQNQLELTITENPDNNIIKVYYVKDDFNYTVKYYYDGVLDDTETERDEAEYQEVITKTPDAEKDKNDKHYVLVDGQDFSITISDDPNENIINVYYISQYNITTKVNTHSEEYVDGTVLQNVKGGTISGDSLPSYEKVLNGNDSTKEIKIKSDDGYEIVKVTILDKADNVTRTLDYEPYKGTDTDGKEIVTIPVGYFESMSADKHVEVEFRKTTNVIIKYFEKTEEGYTDNALATEDELDGYESQEYTTTRKNISNYRAVEDPDGNITPSNATGNMKADTIEVIYYYEKIPAGITVKYLEKVTNENGEVVGVEIEGVTDEVKEGYVGENYETSRKTITDFIPAEPPAVPSGSQNVIYVEKTSNSQNGQFTENSVEIVYWYEKQFYITTDVITHSETDEDGNVVDVKGGSITGEDETPYETVIKAHNNEKEINIVPDDGYRVKQLVINDESINIADIEKDNHTITLPSGYFTNVNENIHVKVEFEKIPAKVTVKYLDSTTKEELLPTEVTEGFVNDDYATERKEIEEYIPADPEPTNKEGKLTEEDITVIYYYTKQFKITTDVIEHEEFDNRKVIDLVPSESDSENEDENEPNEDESQGERISVKGGTISGEDETPYETVNRGKNNAKEIKITSDDGYRIKYVKIKQPGTEIIELKLEDYLNEDNSITLPVAYFKDVQSDKHVIVEFERIPVKVIANYLDVDTEKSVADSELGLGCKYDEYKTYEKEIPYYELLKDKYPENATGKVTEEETIVNYWYRRMLFNMSITKEFTSINVNGKEMLDENNNKFAKIDIQNTEVNNTNITVKYKITVTNTEEIAGTAMISEQVPVGFKLSDQTADAWKFEDGKYVITTKELEPGESVEYEVVLEWDRNMKFIGNLENIARISDTSNIPGFDETSLEDNQDSCLMILSIKTGENRSVKTIVSISCFVLAGICMLIYVGTEIYYRRKDKYI